MRCNPKIMSRGEDGEVRIFCTRSVKYIALETCAHQHPETLTSFKKAVSAPDSVDTTRLQSEGDQTIAC